MIIDLAAPPALTAVTGTGQTQRLLSEADLAALIAAGLGPLPLDGRRVLLIVPDLTRTMPLPLFFRHMLAHLLPRVAAADVLVALGTHPPLTEAELLRLVGLPRVGDRMLFKLAGLDAIDCHVRWVEGYSAGLQFDRPIHPAVFDLLMARLAGNA